MLSPAIAIIVAADAAQPSIFTVIFAALSFQAGVNGICGEHVTAAAVDAYHDFRHSAQRVQFLRELPRGHFIAPPCFRSDVAVKNEFRGIVPACWLEFQKCLFFGFACGVAVFSIFLLPPLTFFSSRLQLRGVSVEV